MEVDHIGVHRTHCCKTHGCKYRDPNCPVELGQIEQDFDCEDNSPDSPCFPIDITRVEVISPKGRLYVNWLDSNSKAAYQLQDGGKTLKIFIQKK